MTSLAEARDEAAALEQLHAGNFTDGLPVVIPTPERVVEMARASGYDPDIALGCVGPSQNAATIEAVAVNAVMAGCLSDHFPVVVAAVRAICDPQFDLTEVQVTTHAVTPLVIVNGPARDRCGVASGIGAFGPGFRANASIGRALRLVMMNIGGGRAGVSDMAVFGHPAKFTFCAAENEKASPWPPLHVSRGWRKEQSTVTVLAVEGPHSAICSAMPDGLEHLSAEAAIGVLAGAIGNLGSNTTYLPSGTIAVVINPLIAQMLAGHGHTRESLQREIVSQYRHERRILKRLNPSLVPAGDDDELLPQRSPETILIFVAGAKGGYCMVCPTLGVGPHKNLAVSKEIELDQVCMLP